MGINYPDVMLSYKF